MSALMIPEIEDLLDYLEPEERAELAELILVYIDVKKMTIQEERALKLVADSFYNQHI